MLHVGRCLGASLQTIPEENPDSVSQGSMETIAETTTKLLPLPPFHSGAIFNVSIDSPPQNGEAKEERAARENRDVNLHSAKQTRLPLRGPSNSLTHKEGHSSATSTMSLSMLTATTSTRPQVPICL